MNWYLYAFQHAHHFSGRTHRAAFWWFMLVHLVANGCLIFLEIMINNPGWIDLVYCLITLLPMLSMMARRLRDTGLSLWWFLIILIPGGVVALLFLLALPSHSSTQELVL